jgi:nitroreductase
MTEARKAGIEESLLLRRSVRGFQTTEVDGALLKKVFTLAQTAPSNCNVQPWIVHVVSGQAARQLATVLHDAAASDLALSPDITLTANYKDVYRERQIGAAKALFSATNVARADAEGRRRSHLRNFRFFDAPHAAFILMPAWAGMREAADCGIYAQSLMLALVAHGLASCAQGALSHHASIIKDWLGIEAEQKLLFGLAFGYADEAHPSCAARTERAPLNEAVTFHG